MTYKYGYTKGSVKLSNKWPDKDPILCAELPHSCDEWVIGDAEDVANMIEDLDNIMREFKKLDDEKLILKVKNSDDVQS